MSRSNGQRTLGEYLSDDLTRTRILRGAAAAFGRNGVAGSPVEEILQEAGVSRRTFYQNFANKEDVLVALFDVALTQLQETTRAAMEGVTDPYERVERAVDANHALMRSAGPLVAVLQAESIRPDSKLAPRREEIFHQLSEVFTTEIHDRTGRDIDPYVLRGCMLINEGLLMHVARSGSITKTDTDRIRGVVIPMIVRVLYADEKTLPPLPGPPPQA